ncbi:MAG TPA: glycosyltransferase, partial [Terriglobales bacterium]|nr:glycosyltransferase [Terriglobales bacterium]
MPTPVATILIVTKNRKDELVRAIDSALTQSVPVEVFVIDDASTDGTFELVKCKFPTVRLERVEQSCGYVIHRNHGVKTATTDIVISIDDDATFPSPRTVEQTLAEFSHKRIGAVAIPYIDMFINASNVRQIAPAAEGIHVCGEYRGTAHALRKEVFTRLGGYHEILFYAGEERDYCLRMLASGYVTRLGRADPIHHFESPNRNRA